MLKRPRDVEDLITQIRSVPEEKRRTIVFVGRHRNERSHVIANKCHNEWEEQSALTVLIPFHWTPQGFWRSIHERAKERHLSEEEIRRFMSRIPHDRMLEEILENAGITASIVHFHYGSAEQKAGLILHNRIPGKIRIICLEANEILCGLPRFARMAAVS